MYDLISRAAALDALGECPYNWCDEIEEIQAVADWREHIDAIKRVPAVDAEPIVRCRDCIFGVPTINALGEDIVICENPDRAWLDQIAIMPDWYCADGERRESE